VILKVAKLAEQSSLSVKRKSLVPSFSVAWLLKYFAQDCGR
jgi:hypothetical protein